MKRIARVSGYIGLGCLLIIGIWLMIYAFSLHFSNHATLAVAIVWVITGALVWLTSLGETP